MPIVTEEILDAAMAAYGQTKSKRADRARLRMAIEAVVSAAYIEGYRKGVEAAVYNDTGARDHFGPWIPVESEVVS